MSQGNAEVEQIVGESVTFSVTVEKVRDAASEKPQQVAQSELQGESIPVTTAFDGEVEGKRDGCWWASSDIKIWRKQRRQIRQQEPILDQSYPRPHQKSSTRIQTRSQLTAKPQIHSPPVFRIPALSRCLNFLCSLG